MATSVPNTTTFSLQDVVAVVTGDDLIESFANSVDIYFDASYKGSKNNLYNFRNYTVSPTLISLDIAFSHGGGVGVYVYTGNVIVTDCPGSNVTFNFNLDFLSSTLPSGQSEYRSIAVNINGSEISRNGAGIIGQHTEYCSGIETLLPVTITYTNDNWDYPRYSSQFRVYLGAISNCALWEAVSTISNNVTRVEAINGVTTTFMTASTSQSYREVSGEMIHVRLDRNTGYTYTEGNGYKPIKIIDSFGTDGVATQKFVSINTHYSGGTYRNYMPGDSYYNGQTLVQELDTINNAAFFSRYTLLNHSGSESAFNFSRSSYKYCSFTTASFNLYLFSFITGAHVLNIYSFSGGNNAYLPSVEMYPNTESLSQGETFSYDIKLTCRPLEYAVIKTGPGGTTLATLYNGDSYTVTTYASYNNTFWYDLGGDINRANVTINTEGSENRAIQFVTSEFPAQNAHTFEIIPTSSNITVNAAYAYKFDYNGIVY